MAETIESGPTEGEWKSEEVLEVPLVGDMRKSYGVCDESIVPR